VRGLVSSWPTRSGAMGGMPARGGVGSELPHWSLREDSRAAGGSFIHDNALEFSTKSASRLPSVY
jgi:hypothetical protein